jgi:tetratricopeptide (TPR) repeat protein
MLTKKNRQALVLFRVIFIVAGMLLAGCTRPGPRALLQGEKLIEQGKYAEAVEKLRSATALLPQSAPAWNHLGLALHHAGEHAEAAKAYQQALQRDREFASARYNLGCLWLDYQNPQAAATEFGAYTRLKPEDANGWLKLGAAYYQTRQLDTAEHCLHTAIRINPRLPEALNLFGLIQSQRNRPGESAKLFQAALQQQQNYAPAILNLAILHHHYLDNRPLALQRYRDYLALKPAPPHSAAVEQAAQNLHTQLLAEQRAAEARVQTAQIPPSELRQTRPQIPPQTAPPQPPPAQSPLLAANQQQPATPGRLAQSPQNQTPALPPDPSQERISGSPDAARSREQPPFNGTSSPHRLPAPGELAKTPDTQTLPPETAPSPFPQPVAPEVQMEIPAAPDLAVQPSPIPARPQTLPPPRTFNEPDPPRNTTRQGPAEEDKSGYVDRLNPLNWVRRPDNHRRETTGALPPPQSATPAPPPQVSVPAAESPAPTPSSYTTSRNVALYPYRNPPKPPPGDRTAAERLLAQGVQAHEGRRLATAFESYQRAAQLDPSSFDAHFNLGLAAYEMRDIRTSLSAYELALAIDPTSRDARYNFALALQRANYPQDAANELQKLLQSHPNDSRAHFTAANLYAQQLDLPEAARFHYRKLLELDPRHPQAPGIRAWLGRNP